MLFIIAMVAVALHILTKYVYHSALLRGKLFEAAVADVLTKIADIFIVVTVFVIIVETSTYSTKIVEIITAFK